MADAQGFSKSEADQTCTMCGETGLFPAQMCDDSTCKQCLIDALM